MKRGRRGHAAGEVVPSAGFEVERCEFVPVDAVSALARLEGHPVGELDLATLRLAVREHGEHELLAAPVRIAEGRWQLAFGIPAAAVEDPDARFKLAARGRFVADVPSPRDLADHDPAQPEELTELQGRLERERNGRLRAEEELGNSSLDLADAQALLEQLRRRVDISERNLGDLRQKLLVAWTESSELRQLLDDREEAHEKVKAEARRRRAVEGELRALLTRQEEELSAARDDVQRRCDELADELAKREAGERLAKHELEEARLRAVALQDAARSALEGFEQARGEADQTRGLLEQAHASAAEAVDELRAELERARDAANVQRIGLEHEIKGLRKSEDKLNGELGRTRDALDSAKSGRRGKLKKALHEAEAERAKLESELTGLLFRLGDLEEKLVETRELTPLAEVVAA